MALLFSDQCSSSKATETMDLAKEENMTKEYSQNLMNGKKSLICGNYPDAVVYFQIACGLQSKRFGDTAPECAEVFFYYGKALLELARQENEVLGNALQTAPEQEDSDDDCDEPSANFPGVAKILREATDRYISTGQFDKSEVPKSSRQLFDIKEESTAKENGSSDAAEKGDSKELSHGEKTAKEKECSNTKANDVNGEKATKEKECANINTNDINGSTEHTQAACSSSSNGEETEENPDDIPNMQLAWEMLELAKVLYSRKPESDENALMIAQCCLKLGELGLEIENYSQAVGDFLECLSMYKLLLPEHDRRLAEVHYSLGLSYNFDKQYEKCIDHYKVALSVLEKRIEYLNEQKVSEVGDSNETSEASQNEIDEIKELIPDIASKIEDVEIATKQHNRLAAFSTSTGFGPGTSQSSAPVTSTIPIRKSGSSSSEKPAADISHLVRKKRTSNEAASSKAVKDEEILSKRAKPNDLPAKVAQSSAATTEAPKAEVVNEDNPS